MFATKMARWKRSSRVRFSFGVMETSMSPSMAMSSLVKDHSNSSPASEMYSAMRSWS